MAAIFVAPLIEHERNQGYESRIITSIEALNQYGGAVIPYELNIKNLIGLPLAFIRLCGYLRVYAPDILITHNFKSSLLPLLAARLMGIPNRIYFNHGVPYQAYSGLLNLIMRGLEAINIFLASEIITVSEDMRNLLLKVSDKKTISLIANGSASGINLNQYLPDQYCRTAFRIAQRISDGDTIFAYIGRSHIRKGLLVVLNLWAEYFSTNPTFKLYLCGPSEADVIRVMGKIPNGVICLGFTKNIPEILANTKYLLLTSLHEGLSYAAIEAMASGCIVVANNIPGIRSLIKNGINGFVIDNNLPQNYQEKISWLESQSQEIQANMRRQAIKTASLYSRDTFLDAYQNFIGKRLDD
ncbi:glycosyltransferase family 4 protein [Polynucleobacter paneuropaeus]|nr:glycosyltransferase family 4 protein [Polynucleobacter paneuropaeus]